jgi:DNA sulfur modification protein DndB
MPTNPEYYPALQAQMGDWVYYIVTMRFADLVERVKRVDEIVERHGLKTWLQRDLQKSRLKQIKEYLSGQKQRFFNAIVVGIYGGAPQWFPVEVSKGVLHREARLPERVQNAFGIIHLRGDEEMFAVDGQHRVEGIKLALQNGGTDLVDEEVAVILVAHRTDDEGHCRARRLFSTLNRYAKKVSQGELIALSEDDTFAIVTRKLVEDYPGLDEEHVPLLKRANLPSTDKRTLLSVVSLCDIVRLLVYPPGIRKPSHLTHGPPDAKDITRIYETAVKFWDCLQEASPEIRKTMKTPAEREIAGEYRNAEGGHFLFRPHCIRALAETVGILLVRGEVMKSAVERCMRSPMDLAGEPWAGVAWNPSKRVIIHKNGLLVRNLLLKRAEAQLEPSDYPLDREYQKAVGEKGP